MVFCQEGLIPGCAIGPANPRFSRFHKTEPFTRTAPIFPAKAAKNGTVPFGLRTVATPPYDRVPFLGKNPMKAPTVNSISDRGKNADKPSLPPTCRTEKSLLWEPNINDDGTIG